MRLLALACLAACSPAGTENRPAAPPPATTAAAVADRGIGGTGISPVEDRGMGGTGIVGVITGFGSIWVNGIEVEFAPATPVRVDGGTAASGALRVGQVAVITATGSGSRLDARSITLRHEVSGPVEAVESNGTVLRVAGQRVTFAGQVWGDAAAPRAGDWVEVSGLPGPDGGIVATRIDRRQPGRVTVHGPLSGTAGAPRIGTLALRPGTRLGADIGQPVTVTGRYADGVLTPDSVSRDAVAADPSGWFGRSVSRLVIESYASAGQGGLRWGHGLSAPVAATFGALGAQPQRTIIEFSRQPDGALEAIGQRSTVGRTGAVPEAPHGIGLDRPGGLGPAGGPGPGGGLGGPGDRSDAGGPRGTPDGRNPPGLDPSSANAGAPRMGSDWGGRRPGSMRSGFSPCGFGDACGAGMFGRDRHGRPPFG
ncbi:hypothetical protein BWR60_25885 [Inquilinus limosus]|uniref:DUF5666 domain-containing protein n=2 Tax=Inquilinus limosus TaxID=171674 RepID=A0A211ZGA1_9PROT|nr:hypothetical protein BWR60_25885 [Inquilinus limosus]